MSLTIAFSSLSLSTYWLIALICFQSNDQHSFRLDLDCELVVCQWLASNSQNDLGELHAERFQDLGVALGRFTANAQIAESTNGEIPVRELLQLPVPNLDACLLGCQVKHLGVESLNSAFHKAYRLGVVQAIEEAAKKNLHRLPGDLQLSDMHRLRLQIQSEPDAVLDREAQKRFVGDHSGAK